MISWIRRLLGYNESISPLDVAFGSAMRESGELINQMREASNSNDVFRAMTADIWAQRHNVTFMTMVFETVEEMKSGADQQPGTKQDGHNQNP